MVSVSEKQGKIVDRGKENDDALPKIPELTDAMLAEADAIQAKRAKAHPSGGSRAVVNANAIINQLEGSPDLSEEQRHLLAEALAETGRFDKAYVLTGNPYYRDVWQAIHKDDAENCDCKDTTTTVLENGQPKQITHKRYFTKRMLYSIKHNKELKLEVCNICSHMNAR